MNLVDEIKSDFEKLNQKEGTVNKKVDEIDSSIKTFSNFAWALVWVGLAIIIISLVIVFCFPKYNQVLNDFGTFVGGTVASLWSLAGLFFIYVAFLGQKQQLILQQLEIKFSQIELKATRLELEGQKEQMMKQNATLKHQRFENTFFQLVNIHTSIVSSMDLRKIANKSIIAEGRDCFNNFYQRLQGKINNPEVASLEDTLKAYVSFFIDNQNDLGHYFRNLYHIIKFVATSDLENKKTYTNFVRAQLSSYELVLIFYNCLSSYGTEKFKPLIEEFSLLKNMDKELVFNKTDLNEYLPKAYE
jgi:hypothetical protein